MSLEEVRELLAKQKLVEGMVHNLNRPNQGVVDTLVHRQHLSELGALLARLSAAEISDILEALPAEDARLLWKKIPGARENDVRWEISDSLRERLAGVLEPDAADSQINAFELVDGRLRQVAVSGRKDLDGIRPIWVDLVSAGPARRTYVGGHFGVRLPEPGDTIDLEVSTRFHVEENGDIHLHSNFLSDRDENARSVPVIFIVHDRTLFSLCDEELPVFRLQRRRARINPGHVTDCYDLLVGLYGADVEYSADSLEGIYDTLNDVGKQVLSQTMSDQEAATVLTRIAEVENLNGQIRGNILDTQRALAFLIQCRVLSPDQLEDVREILRNIESLNSHTSFVFDKINFLMDATIGFINVNQNRRVTQLTVFGVVFMPINIIAGIGGMSEFTMMTQGIPWPIAYGAFIATMALIGFGTFTALKHFENKKIRQAAKAKQFTQP